MPIPRTSVTHPIRVDFLPTPGLPGRVGMTFAPGKKSDSAYGSPWDRDLATDLDRLVQHHGIHVLVCLLEDHELHRLQIPDLVPAAESRGLTVHRLPIPDGGVLPSTHSVRALVTTIANHARAGRSIAIHCRGGLGRAGTIAGCFLVDQGMTPDQAIDTLHEVRSHNSPETPQQEAFIARFLHPDRAS
jgi:protein-tyrosine phosphatase